jgi:glycosyltransferase involved in cell wall biosynthesis
MTHPGFIVSSGCSPTIWADVEDLFDCSRLHAAPGEAQRLAFELQQELHKRLTKGGRLRFVRHARRGHGPPLQEVPWADIETLFSQLVRPLWRKPSATGTLTPGGSWLLAARRRVGRIASQMPSTLREPLLRSWFLQKHAALEFKELFRTRRARLKEPALPAASIREGDIFLVLGSPWFHADFVGLLKDLRENYRTQVALLLHDVTPVIRQEWCARDRVESFHLWLETTLPLYDVLLSVSDSTAHELEAWARRMGIRLAGPVRTVPIGTRFGKRPEAPQPRPPGLPAAGSYVLFVSALEARKNHALLVRVWRRLLDEEQSQLRPPGSVPDLVFAGRVGWLVADLMQQLENSSWLGGRVRFMRDPSDVELRALYEGCMFTLFPSLHEGWGLPVSEALSLGVPVLCSSATALPEAGGDFARYFDPEDVGSCYRAVVALLDHPEELAAWRAEIRARYQPIPWSATAQALLEALPGNWDEMLSDAAERRSPRQRSGGGCFHSPASAM